jgi:hypothetical protein
MGFFKNIGKALGNVAKAVSKVVSNIVSTSVGKVGATLAAVLAAPLTGGLSLLSIPRILKKEAENAKLATPTDSDVVTPPPTKPIQPAVVQPAPVIEPVIAIVPDYPTDAVAITPPKKTDVTLYGYYKDINKITIPVDVDLDNVIVVPNTTFPYIVRFTNYRNAIGRRYVSEYTYLNLVQNFQTNLGKIISDMDFENGNYSYITLDWKKFDNLIVNRTEVAKKEGGIVKPVLSPEFLLQWLEGNKLTYLLDYSYVIPKGVKTIGDLDPAKEDRESSVSKAFVLPDDTRQKKLEMILSIIAGGAAFYGIAQSALGNIKSRFDQAKGMVGSLKNTAEGLQDRFNDVQGQLNKDALEGKVNQLSDAAGNLKSSVKSKIPRVKAQLKQEIEEKKKKLKRKPKDPKAKKKFTLQNFELPSLPPIPQPPTLPDANSIGNLAGVPTTPDAALAVSGLNSNSVSSIVNSTNIETPSLPSLPTSTSISTSTSTSTSTSFSSTTTNSTSNTAGTNLQLTKYQTNATVGYGVGKSQSESMARQIASFQARQDLAKKLNKSTISAGEFDSKTYLLNGNIYQVEVALKEN